MNLSRILSKRQSSKLDRHGPSSSPRLRQTSHVREQSEYLGSTLIELALTLPILLSLTFGGLEVSKIFQVKQTLSSVSREAANASFRDCSPVVSSSGCLETVRATTSTFANSLFTGIEVVISVYDYFPAGANPSTEPATVKLRNVAGLSTSTGRTPLGKASRFTPEPANPLSPQPSTDLFRAVPASDFKLQSLTNDNRIIVVGEVFYNYLPTLGSVHLPFFAPISKPLYEVTVF